MPPPPKKKKSLAFLWPLGSLSPSTNTAVCEAKWSITLWIWIERKWGDSVHLLLFPSAFHHLISNLISTWILFLVQFTTSAQMLMTEKGLTQGKKIMEFLEDSLLWPYVFFHFLRDYF